MTSYFIRTDNGKEDVTQAMVEIYIPSAQTAYPDAEPEVQIACAMNSLWEDLGTEVFAA